MNSTVVLSSTLIVIFLSRTMICSVNHLSVLGGGFEDVFYRVEPTHKYTVKNLTNGTSAQYTGKQFHEGLKVTVIAGAELRLTIE